MRNCSELLHDKFFACDPIEDTDRWGSEAANPMADFQMYLYLYGKRFSKTTSEAAAQTAFMEACTKAGISLNRGANIIAGWLDEIAEAFKPIAEQINKVQEQLDATPETHCPQHGTFLEKDHCPICRRHVRMQSSNSTKSRQNWRSSVRYPRLCQLQSRLTRL